MKRYLTMLTLAVSFVGCQPPKSPTPNPADSDVQVQIADYAAIQRLIASHRGKVVVVDVWATTCPPCRKEFPHLVELHKKYGPEKIACVSLSLDYTGEAGKPPESYQPKVLKFLRERGATFENIIASEETDAMYEHLQITNPPAVFVYDKTGQRHEKITPDVDADPQAAGIYDRVTVLVEEWIE